MEQSAFVTIPSNCTSCFETRQNISQTIQQESKAKNKVIKFKGLLFFFSKELQPAPIQWCTFVCLIKWPMSAQNTGKDCTRPCKVRLWQPSSALQREITCAPEGTSTSSSAFPWQSWHRNSPRSVCVAHKVTRLSPGAYGCKYFCIWFWQWNINNSNKRTNISHRGITETGNSRNITNTSPEPFWCH